ncbi:MAG: transketolase C-terminal domain-containing protein [Chloroflexota bacterium]
MAKRTPLEVSVAVAEAAKMADVDVVAAYPITPQTHIVETLAEMVANGELDANYIPVESEHSAMSACLGSSATGARTFTSSAGQGLELMHEALYIGPSSRLPMVLSVCNRALSGPLSVWGDHSDAMAVRDTGWIQVFVENGQQAFDHILWAFRVSEDHQVLFPVMVHHDGFHLTHVIEPITLPTQEDVDRFLPKPRYPYALHPDNPVSIGCYAPPHIYSEVKRSQDAAFRSPEVKQAILKAWEDFGNIFGRYYSPVEQYRTEGAKVLLVTMGSFSETAMVAVDNKREEGKEVGIIRLRLWRPFPYEEIRELVKDADMVVVLDRCISPGAQAPVYSEIRSCLYQEENRPQVFSFTGGLGGRDIVVSDFEQMIDKGFEMLEKGSDKEFEIIGVRE